MEGHRGKKWSLRDYFSSQTKKNKSSENDDDQGKGPDAIGNFCVVCEKICHHFRDTNAPGELFSHQILHLLPPDPPSIKSNLTIYIALTPLIDQSALQFIILK